MDRVFVKLDEKKQSSIIVEEEENTKSGVVVSVGSLVKSVIPGERVIFYRFDDLPVDKDGIVAVREYCLLGVIE